MTIKTVTVDFWNTLYNSKGGFERNKFRQRALIQELDRYDRIVRKNEFDAAMKSSWEFFNKIWFDERRTPKPEETITYIWNYLKMEKNPQSIERISEAFADSTLVHPPDLNPGAKEAIEQLSEDFNLAIVSDTGFASGKLLKELLEKDGIIDYFDYFSFSDETNVSKPHPRAFQIVLEHFECEPGEAIHIGDIEKTDIKGAIEAGMHAIRYSGDKTAGSITKQNSKDTLADKEIDTWEEIVKFIYYLR
jgi:putative hydrolase of the HAD superfamily